MPAVPMALKDVGAKQTEEGIFIMPSGKQLGEFVHKLNEYVHIQEAERSKSPKLTEGTPFFFAPLRLSCISCRSTR